MLVAEPGWIGAAFSARAKSAEVGEGDWAGLLFSSRRWKIRENLGGTLARSKTGSRSRKYISAC